MDLGNFFHFRCHTDKLDLGDLVEFLKQQTDVLCIVREFGTREHIHSTLLLKTAKTTFIDRLKRKFPMINGNGAYSMKPVKNFDSNIRYNYKGTASDYPDILYTKHTEQEWKNFYKEWWETKQEILLKSQAITKSQEDSKSSDICDFSDCQTVKKKVVSKSFTLKFCENLWKEHGQIFGAIWYFHGYKETTPINDLEWCQDYVSDLYYRALGKAAKNIDDFIFERNYRGVYAYILEKCPMNLTAPISKSHVSKFRHKLLN